MGFFHPVLEAVLFFVEISVWEGHVFKLPNRGTLRQKSAGTPLSKRHASWGWLLLKEILCSFWEWLLEELYTLSRN